MKKIKIDVVALPLSGHLYPTMNLLAPLLQNPQYEIRLLTGPQKKAVAEAVGFQVLPILEGHVKEFEKAANNKEQLGIISAYRQLSASLDLINLVSDQLIQEWTNHRPDIAIVDFITLSGGLVAEQMGIPQNSWQALIQFIGRKGSRLVKCLLFLLFTSVGELST